MPPQSNKLRRRAFNRPFAKSLRTNPTDAERKLWPLLRGKQLATFRFRRQQPIGPYIVDFFCPSAKLIVELDGGQHGTDASIAYDETRTRFLNARGYRVLRFWNADVLRDPQTTIDAIWHTIQESRPSP